MDFHKSCATGVQTLTGFTSVFYHVYTLERKDDSAEKSLDDGLLFAEASLRAWKRLVYVDTVRRALWTFDGGGNTSFAEGPELSKISKDWDFALICNPIFLIHCPQFILTKVQQHSKARSRLLSCHTASPEPLSQTITLLLQCLPRPQLPPPLFVLRN
jgi:hypothetical protein